MACQVALLDAGHSLHPAAQRTKAFLLKLVLHDTNCTDEVVCLDAVANRMRLRVKCCHAILSVVVWNGQRRIQHSLHGGQASLHAITPGAEVIVQQLHLARKRRDLVDHHVVAVITRNCQVQVAMLGFCATMRRNTQVLNVGLCLLHSLAGGLVCLVAGLFDRPASVAENVLDASSEFTEVLVGLRCPLRLRTLGMRRIRAHSIARRHHHARRSCGADNGR
mmetsp:Transcript_12292/g.36071  ORF Transcript_12292/g.36071 Transcript_12292/m.36071 type:complete len:221 (-) Transcript_12292:240-902(-)